MQAVCCVGVEGQLQQSASQPDCRWGEGQKLQLAGVSISPADRYLRRFGLAGHPFRVQRLARPPKPLPSVTVAHPRCRPLCLLCHRPAPDLTLSAWHELAREAP